LVTEENALAATPSGAGERGAARHVRVRVHYPLAAGRLVLRSDRDWDADVEPVGEDPGGTCFEFELTWEHGVHSYFKPVLHDAAGIHWAQGENYLALSTFTPAAPAAPAGSPAGTVALPGAVAPTGAGTHGGPVRDLYPHFFSDFGCSECGILRRRSRDGEREHALRVFYPPGYDENTLESFPVVYMQDGQNLFFPQEAFGGNPWRIGETLRILDAMNLIRKVIVVGIYPRDRQLDYTQEGYESYGRYLVEEVKPWVDATYRTLRGPQTTVTMGSSLGGLVSLLLGWRWPEVFGCIGCLSSTFGWREDLFERVGTEPLRPIRIYLDSGWPRDNYEVTRAIRDLLVARGYTQGRDLLYLAFPRATHDEASWAMRAHIPFQFFFGG
jgi:predicted alpha/beta superfamily hydrolase